MLALSSFLFCKAQTATNTFPSTGYAGIGTTTPVSDLTITSTNSINPNNTNADLPYSSITFQNKWSGSYLIGRIAAIQENNRYVDAAAMVFSTGVGGLYERMRINTAGNLLIGKTSQTNTAYKFDVNGSIRANSIVVNTTGADYVFDAGYKLPALNEVRKYIEANHHLPGISPAANMQSTGFDLGENQTRLLAKIEELTLYLIEKDKQLSDERQTIQNQRRQLDAQKDQLQLYKQQLQGLSVAIKRLQTKMVKN